MWCDVMWCGVMWWDEMWCDVPLVFLFFFYVVFLVISWFGRLLFLFSFHSFYFECYLLGCAAIFEVTLSLVFNFNNFAILSFGYATLIEVTLICLLYILFCLFFLLVFVHVKCWWYHVFWTLPPHDITSHHIISHPINTIKLNLTRFWSRSKTVSTFSHPINQTK